jgi:hypothetical protein
MVQQAQLVQPELPALTELLDQLGQQVQMELTE